MSLWKSPILYVGIALVLAVMAALVAPFVIDWNGYRAEIEDYGRRLTGRQVKVQGPIAVRLFPWPSLTLNQVSVANPVGAADPNLMEAEKLVARMTLGGLIGGSIDVERVDVMRPIFSLERLATGHGTWRLAPAANLAKSKLLDQVKLDQIHVVDGALRIADRRRGGVAVFQHISGTLSAPAIQGPWRARLIADYGDANLAIAVTTGQWRADQPLKFSFSLTPPQGSGFNYAFDGENDGTRIAGTLRAEPQPADDGKNNALPAWRSLAMMAKVTSNFDHVKLEDIEIASRKSEAGGTLISGRLDIALGASIGIDAKLAAPRFDLDRFAGDETGKLLGGAGGLATVAGLLDALPEGIDGKLSVDIGALKARGAVLENAEFDASLSEGALRIRRLHAKLPGLSEALFEGVFLADPAGPQLAGDIALESANLRELARWAVPEARDAIGQYWKGNRGRLKLETRLDASSGRFRLSGTEFELDGKAGTLSLGLATGTKPAADIALTIAEADIDGFVAAGTLNAGWIQGAAERMLAGPSAIKIDLKADRLRLNGTQAEAVAVEAKADAQGLGISRLSAGQVEGASLDISGNLQRDRDGLAGALRANVAAAQPRGLLRLLGLIPADTEPAWLAALGATDAKIEAELKPKEGLPGATLRVSGRSGELNLEGNVSLEGGLDWRVADLAGVAELDAKRGIALARLFGISPVGEGGGPGRAAVTIAGSLAKDLRGEVEGEAFGVEVSLAGTVRHGEGGLASKGVAKLAAADTSSLAAAVGCGACGGGRFEAAARFEADAKGLRLNDVTGLKDGEAFGGSFAVMPDLSVRGEMSVAKLALGDVLALALLRWDGNAPDIGSSLSAKLPMGLTGEVWIKPSTLHVFEGLDVGEAQIGLSAIAGEKRLAVSSPGGESEQVAIEVGAREERGGAVLDGRISLPLDLARLKSEGAPVANGMMRVEASFAGAGRSGTAVLADLRGAGAYRLKGTHLAAIDVPAFLAAAETAQSGSELTRALNSLLGGKGVDIADRSGSLSLANGAVSFQPINMRGERAQFTVTPSADLPSGVVSLGVTVNFDGAGAPPSLAIGHVGAPGEMARSIDAGKTMSEFGLRLLRKGVDELERLQREADRLAAEEEAQRRENAERVAAWEGHRQEMARRARITRAQAEMRERAKAAKAEEERRMLEGFTEMNKAEMARRVRALRAMRNLRRLRQASAEDTPVFGSDAKAP